ncbi:hypothetical protein, partial [Burkholderia thailandensis]|uniref:hypothetical protein n=1 Tax=Burkholderia thailandensis TaxID=57975 RepID=UPI003F8FB054
APRLRAPPRKIGIGHRGILLVVWIEARATARQGKNHARVYEAGIALTSGAQKHPPRGVRAGANARNG